MTLGKQILERAPEVLARQPNASVSDLAKAAGASRASFYRHFKSRQALLDALEVPPEPATRERILDAAVEWSARRG